MSRETEENINERQEIADSASRYLGRPVELLTDRERAVFRRHLARRAITRDSNRSFDEKLTSGQRLADKVAEFGGSWTFIITFALYSRCGSERMYLQQPAPSTLIPSSFSISFYRCWLPFRHP